MSRQSVESTSLLFNVIPKHFAQVYTDQTANLNTHLYQNISGSVNSLPHTPSWRIQEILYCYI